MPIARSRNKSSNYRQFNKAANNHFTGTGGINYAGYQGSISQTSRSCDDFIAHGNEDYQDNPLDVVHSSSNYPTINGSLRSLRGWVDYNNHLAMTPWDGLPALDVADWGALGVEAVANMNPNSPVIDIPQVIFELKDLPRMIQSAGKILSALPLPRFKFRLNRKDEWLEPFVKDGKGYHYTASGLEVMSDSHLRAMAKLGKRPSLSLKDAPDQYLAYKFGWAPLISDALTLFGLAESLDNRFKNLQSMQKSEQISRSLGSSQSSGSLPDERFVWQYTEFSAEEYVSRTYIKESNAWFTATPTLLSDFPPRYSAEFIKQSLKVGEADAVTLWNSLPWSWLIDYFSNFGTYLEAIDNRLRWEYGTINVMHYSRVRAETPSSERTSPPWVKRTRFPTVYYYMPEMTANLNAGFAEHEAKRRRVLSNFVPRLHFTPALTTGQGNILGALFTSLILGGAGYRS